MSMILEFNKIGIENLKNGKWQDSLDNFQASIENLLTCIDVEAQRKASTEEVVTMSSSSSIPQPNCKRKRMTEEPNSQSLNTNYQLTSPSVEEKERQQLLPAPSTIRIPLETPTFDTFPEHAATLFNQALLLPKEYGLLPEKYNIMYVTILYHQALVLHNFGLRYSCGSSLRKSLETYEIAHGVLVQELQWRSRNSHGSVPGNNHNHDDDIHHWLLYALFNNISNIYSFARSTIMTQFYLNQLRLALAFSDSALLETSDLLVFVVNIDVLGGPGVITAAAA